LQELLLEHADLFYHFKSIAPSGTITQDDIKDITDALQEDSRYKALDRLDQDRKLMLFQHLGFVHCPIREHCPAFPNCMDALIERILATKAHRLQSKLLWSGRCLFFVSVGRPLGIGVVNGC
jgi:glucocorticoid receptor DNA-binding factor 1